MTGLRLVAGPGGGFAARRADSCLLVAAAADPAAADLLQAWSSTTPDDVADALFDVVRQRRPAAVTAFCALTATPSGLQVAMHGRLALLAAVNGEQIDLQGRDADSRFEETIGGVITMVTVAAHGTEVADAPLMNLVEGIVSAGSLRLTWPAVPAAAPAPARDPTVIGVGPPATDSAQAPFEHRPTLAVEARPELPTATEVDGVLCIAGHFNNPEAAACAVCGQPITQALVRRARPALGRLLTQDGREFIVDRPIMIGRIPAQSAAVADGSATGVDVPAEEKSASRLHAGLELEGWSVLVRDLGSANGTFVLPAGITEWFRVEPDHPIEIEHGTVIAVGAFELKYERLAL